MTLPGRNLVHRLGAIIAAAILLGAALPAVAPLDVRASDDAAAGDRLIVIWKDHAPRTVEVTGVQSMTTSQSTRRTVVTALHGSVALTAARLRRDPRVTAVVPDLAIRADGWPADAAPNDTYYTGYQADLALIGVPDAWRTTTGAGVTVAILDTGITASHPDLACLALVAPHNAINGSTNVADGHGHGTHTTGTVAACTNNGQGVAGIAPGVRIMPVKVLDDQGSGYFSYFMDGIDWARTHGAQVINMSLGGSITDPATVAVYQGPITTAWQAGLTIVASAGNSGDSSVKYPAAFDHVISVAATDNAGAKASFSTYNEFVDIAAPGVGTASTYLNGTYTQMSGTSMAAPHITATAALVRSAHPDDTPDQVEAVIEATATDKGPAGRDDSYGSGLVNAAAAVAYAIDPANPPTVRPNPSPRPLPTTAPTPAPTPTPAGHAPKITTLRASTKSVSYDPNHYCEAAAKSAVITALTAVGSATTGAATSAALTYLRPDGSSATVAMTRGATSSTATTWTATVATTGDALLRTAGTIAYSVTATAAAGVTTRSPAGTANASLGLAVCPNIAPAITVMSPGVTSVYTNPLGSGTVPSWAATSLPLAVVATDSDGVAAVSAVLSGAGLAAPVSVPLTLGAAGTWTATVDPTAIGAQGGPLTWRAYATDTLGAVSAGRVGPGISVVRADTPAQVDDTGLVLATGNVPTVTFSVVDPDATLGPASTTGGATVTWRATYTAPTGAAVTSAAATVRASYTGGGTFAATLPGTWLNTSLRDVRITVTPAFKDPWAAAVAGSPLTATVVPLGPPVVTARTASASAAYTNPLGTGDTRALASLPDTVTFAARVADTDDLGGVALVLSGAGLPAPVSVPMTADAGAWATSVRLSSVGVTATGTLTWKIAATDEAGLTGVSGSGTIRVTRANTPGSATITDVSADPAGAGTIVVTLVADDPDAAFGTTTNLGASIRWSGTIGSTTYSSRSVAASWAGGHTFKARIAVATTFRPGTTARIVVVPVAVDPYKGTTTGAAVTATLSR